VGAPEPVVELPSLPKLVLAAAALAPLLSAAGCGNGGSEARTSPPPRDPVVAVAAVEVAPRDLSLSLNLSGTVEPIREVRVAARMAGILHAVNLEEGQRVQAGQVLARFDVAEQAAQLDRAHAQFNLADAGYRRARNLRDRQLISEMEYDNARAERAAAESEVRLWETRTGLGTVTAPSAGVVTVKSVEAGDAVSNGDPLFVVADVSTLVVKVGVADVYVARLSVGQPVRVSVDAMPGRAWKGRIRRIFPAADPESRLHPVEFQIAAGARDRPAPGYLARIDVDVERRRGVLAVPSEALLASAGEDPFVFVIDNDKLERREVVTGVSRRDWTEMLKGLRPGELVVASNPANLREGMAVRVSELVGQPGGGPDQAENPDDS